MGTSLSVSVRCGRLFRLQTGQPHEYLSPGTEQHQGARIAWASFTLAPWLLRFFVTLSNPSFELCDQNQITGIFLRGYLSRKYVGLPTLVCGGDSTANHVKVLLLSSTYGPVTPPLDLIGSMHPPLASQQAAAAWSRLAQRRGYCTSRTDAIAKRRRALFDGPFTRSYRLSELYSRADVRLVR